MNNMSWFISALYFVSFVIYVVPIVNIIRNAHTIREFLPFYGDSLMTLMARMSLISIVVIDGKLATNGIVTWGRVLWFEIMLCIIYSGWYFITFIAALIDSYIDYDYLKPSSSLTDYLACFYASALVIMVSITVLYKSYENADIHTMLFSAFNRKTEMSGFIIGCLGWGIILFSVVWHLFFIIVGIIVIVDAVRCRIALTEILKNNGNVQLMEIVSQHEKKIRLFNDAFEIVVFEVMRILPLINESAYLESLAKKEFTYSFIEQYLKERKFYTSSELFSIWNTNERYFGLENRIRIKQAELDRLNGKITLETENRLKDSEKNAIAIVRDIYHLTKAPLLTISQESKNIEIFKDDVEHQEESRKAIENQIFLVEIILDGFRQIAMELPDPGYMDDVELLLKTAAQSASKTGNKTVPLIIKDPLPKIICYQGNRYAAIILKPLIDNAVEASPNGKPVIVRCYDKEDECIVTVENECINVPGQQELETVGFTTKEAGGIGLESVRRLTEKGNFKFSIIANEETNTVIAEVKFLKSKH